MKRIIGFIIGIGLIVAIGFGIYKFFFDCQKTYAYFGKTFILEKKFDYAVIDDEAVVKLLGVDDNRCFEGECAGQGQFVVKLLVLNDMKMSYVTLGTLSESEKDIDSLKYMIELEDLNDDGIFLKLSKMEEKKK